MKLSPLINKAIAFAQKVHEDQEYNGGPFFTHPWQTAQLIATLTDDEDLICAAFLHDTIEDAGVTFEELCNEFNPEIASLVKEVTKDGYNSFPHLKTQKGVMLKFADRLSNVSNMDEWSEEKRHRYLFEKSRFWK